jgi:hypothetical protein
MQTSTLRVPKTRYGDALQGRVRNSRRKPATYELKPGRVVRQFDSQWGKGFMAKKEVFRVVTRAADGSLKIRDFHSAELIFRTHTQVGVDDSSTDLDLRGIPIFKGLIGPIPEGKNIARYESHDVFELMTKEWAVAKPRRRRRSGSVEEPTAEAS